MNRERATNYGGSLFMSREFGEFSLKQIHISRRMDKHSNAPFNTIKRSFGKKGYRTWKYV